LKRLELPDEIKNHDLLKSEKPIAGRNFNVLFYLNKLKSKPYGQNVEFMLTNWYRRIINFEILGKVITKNWKRIIHIFNGCSQISINLHLIARPNL
jgi:hypothetical protein